MKKNKTTALGVLFASVSFIIYIVSVMFAINVLVEFMVSPHTTLAAQILLVTSMLTCNTINFALAHKYPDRFYSWDKFKQEPESIKAFIFLPPFSTLFSSAALTIFVMSLFSKPINAVWEKSLSSLDSVYEIAGRYLVLTPFLAAIFLCVLGLLVYATAISLKKFKKTVWKTLVIILFVILFAIWIYLVSIFQPGHLETKLVTLAKNVVKYIVWFTPAYWFYILFISSKRIRF